MAIVNNSASRSYEAAYQKTLVYAKTSIGGFIFDAYLKLEHTSQLKITEFPISTGSSITDHSFLQPQTLTIDIGMTDVAKSIIPGQFTGDASRSVAAFKLLQELQAARVPISIVTRLKKYENMLIETMTTPDDYTTVNALKATVVFKEILVVNVQTVKLSAKPQTTGSTNKGKAEVVKPNTSVIKSITNAITGKGK